MQLSEYKREIKGHSIKGYMKELMYSKKGRVDYSEHRISSHSQKPPVIENMADYIYNRKFYQ